MTLKHSNRAAAPAAKIELAHRRVRADVMARVIEFSENGLTDHEIAAHLNIPAHLVRLIVRGSAGN